MRYIFMDEAGTSAREPVTVVVGVIANADEHVLLAEGLALEAMGAVPPEFSDDFVFHATQVYGDRAYQSGWALTDRLRLLTNMMSIPRRVGMAVTVSAQWRAATDNSDAASAIGMSTAQLDHVMAFATCVAVADRNIRRHAGAREVATIVAEDVPEMRRFLKVAAEMFKVRPMHLSPDLLRTTSKDKAAGYSTQSGEFRVTRVRNSVHFVEKAEDPLVQVADACAYGFRRYFAGEKFGSEFVRAILGNENMAAHFASPGGTECWWFHQSTQALS